MSSPTYTSIEIIFDHYLMHPEVTTDSRNVPVSSLFFALKGDNFDGNRYAASALEKGAAYAVVDDPEVAVQIGERALLVEDGLKSLQQLANHYRRKLKMPILAITGSNGKTTTKELVASVMSRRYKVHFTQGNYNNHIGLPLTLLQIGPDVEMAIIEMGANHQKEIAALCQIAEPTHGLITNIGEAHLEGFGGIEGVKIGKGELYDYLAEHKGIAFVNLDAEHLPAMAERLPRRVNYKTSEQPSPAEAAMETKLLSLAPNVEVAFLNAEGELQSAATNLPGMHNFENIKAAVAIGKYFKVASKEIAAGLMSYLPENNRSQRLEQHGIKFFLDAYNANPSSTDAALRAFVASTAAPRIAVLGGMLELGEASDEAHLRIAQLAVALKLDKIALVGPTYAAVGQALGLPHFADVAALANWFWQQELQGYNVFLKGSRGIKLEKVLEG